MESDKNVHFQNLSFHAIVQNAPLMSYLWTNKNKFNYLRKIAKKAEIQKYHKESGPALSTYHNVMFTW